jgi:hypothetical protein
MNGRTRFHRFDRLYPPALFLCLLLTLVACAAPGTGQSAATAPAPTAVSVAEDTPMPPATTTAPPTATPLPPTETPTPIATATPTPAPSPTLPPRVANTLLLYTTAVADPSGQAFWAVRTLPPLPQLDATIFDTLYGPRDNLNDFSMFFADRRPQLSPDGQTLLVPGLTSYPEYGVVGTGTWLIDLATGAARQLLSDGVSATWSPASDAITYVEGTTLYTLSTAEGATAAGATPQPLFEEPSLWPLYAQWSPTGQWIATMSGVQDETTGDLTFTYWLVPAAGGPAREFASRMSLVAEFSARQVSWSADGDYLLAHNFVYDLAGNQLLPEETGGLTWLPGESRLLQNGETLRILSVTGEEVAAVPDSTFTASFAWSRDGRRLAFGLPRTDEGIAIAIFDLDEDATQVAGVIPGALYINELQWSGDDTTLLVEVDHGEGESRYDIWTLPAAPNSTAERLLSDAVLIDALPYP